MASSRGRMFHEIFYLIAILMVFTFVHSVFTWYYLDTETLSRTTLGDISGDLFGIAACTTIYISVLMDRRNYRGTHIFMLLLGIETMLLFFDLQCWVYDGHTDRRMYLEIINHYVYGLVLILIAAYWILLRELYQPHARVMRRLSWVIGFLFAVDMILIVTNPIHGMFFYLDDAAVYHRSDMFYISLIVPNLIGVIEVACIICFETRRRRKVVFLSYIFLSWMAMIVQVQYYCLSLQYLSFMVAFILMYANIYLDRGLELASNESEMNEQRAAIMVSQIQPHFLYNSLTSIMNIKGNPQQTRDAIAEFGMYLRSNLDSITSKNPISITRELDHVETYVNLRKLRLGDDLTLVLDTEDTSFFITPQAVKALVSSLINSHEGPTTITITTRSLSNGHLLTVKDSCPQAWSYDTARMVSRLNTVVKGNIHQHKDSGGVTVEIFLPRSRRRST